MENKEVKIDTTAGILEKKKDLDQATSSQPPSESLQDDPGDVGDIAGEFHQGGGLEGYAHEIETNQDADQKLKDLDS